MPTRPVIRTTYSEECDALWSVAMDKLRRWVSHYFIHYIRLMEGKVEGTVNEELGRRFILEVADDSSSEKLQPPDPERASQDDIKSLTGVFGDWLGRAVGDADIHAPSNPRFVDFLVIDEGSLRSLAALPDETPPLGPITRQERFVGCPYI
jgi:hypothetical protein